MVKRGNKDNTEKRINQGQKESSAKASKIGASTAYEYCSERISPFGGGLGLEKFMDLVGFKEIFNGLYRAPTRQPKLGHYEMVYGLIMLLFIGFNRVWHFIYIELDSMVCGIFNLLKLPYVTTYWRYVNSLGLNQGKSLLMVISALRERVWHLCKIRYEVIHIDIDTTVETIYGNQQGGRKGHNTKNRGKKGYRPVLCFIQETREYIAGKLRKGETMSGQEVADLIYMLKKYLPGCVKRVILRGDGEFISWESVEAATKEGYDYIFGNKRCKLPFESSKWYKVRKRDKIEYNECVYRPMGWAESSRFVAMRIPKDEPLNKEIQCQLFEDDKYKHRIFVTSLTKKAHKVIKEYDKRADCENLIGEAKQEGLAAIPSAKFANNYAYFQIVMLSINIWRSMKMLAGRGLLGEGENQSQGERIEIVDNTIRIARLKLLYIGAKITSHSGVNKVKYSQHDSRVESLFRFYRYMDKLRGQIRPWLEGRRWTCRHLKDLGIKQIAFSP
ncbi:MAG: IS1380 family transposase [Colwellia sp.]|nr:IS1380 family transposase [Colwellia sp.]